MKTSFSRMCPIHKIPLKDGICPICEKENKEKHVKKIVANKGISEPVLVKDDQQKERICPNCGQKVPVEGQFCIYCGAELPTTLESASTEEGHKSNEFELVMNTPEKKGKSASINLKLLSKPVGYYGRYQDLEFLYYPKNDFLLVQNGSGSPWYLKTTAPTPIYNGQEIRFGEIGFIMKYAGETINGLEGTQLLGLKQNKPHTSILLDYLECVHPNFIGKTINIEKDELSMNRAFLTTIFDLSDEKYLKAAGVSSKQVLLKKISYWWYVFPDKAPNIFLKIPNFFVPVKIGEGQLFNRNTFFEISIK